MKERTYQKVSLELLIKELLPLSFEELERLYTFVADGKYGVFKDKLIAICLCQGLAQHLVESSYKGKIDSEIYVEMKEIRDKNFLVSTSGQVLSGIKDIDIWFFFEESEKVKMPHIKNMLKSINTELECLGEIKIDFLKKSVGSRLDGYDANFPKKSVVKYITTKGTKTSQHLSYKSIVGLHPKEIEGEVIWAVNRIKPNKPIKNGLA